MNKQIVEIHVKKYYINSKVNHNILNELGFFVLKNAFKKAYSGNAIKVLIKPNECK